MTKLPRRKVVRFEERPNTGPSQHLFPVVTTAVLTCGHTVNLGVSDLRPKRMACWECETQKK
jgi:hypothetical protein